MPQEEICGSEFDSDHVRHRIKQKQLVGEESTMIYIACKEILARISLTTLIPCIGNASSMNVASVLHLYNKYIQENNLNNEYMLLI
jgi:hypothetical protein